MIHEITLSLSGHPSALFDTESTHSSRNVPASVGRLLSPSEIELLSSIGNLSRVYQQARDHASTIVAAHPSTICRAVASAMASHHLEAFEHKIFDVETRLLCKDVTTVGAYNIVPLAALVSEFGNWTRLLKWLWDLGLFIMPAKSNPKDVVQSEHACTGAQLMNRLRSEVQTGFPEIQVVADNLVQVAEAAWLRQLSAWLLHGRPPGFGGMDFFIQRVGDELTEGAFRIHHSLLPKFVTRQSASSILFIGTSIQQARSMSPLQTPVRPAMVKPELDMFAEHVHMLSHIATPVAAADLSEIVKKIRVSLSRNLLQFLLPREKITGTLSILHQFFLLGRGEFAISLITQADAYMLSHTRTSQPSTKGQLSRGLMLKDTEASQILGRSLSALSGLIGEDQHIDDILEAAGRVLRLRIQIQQGIRPGTPGRAKETGSMVPEIVNASFDEMLLSVPTSLVMEIESPLDLFVTKSDINVYSLIHSYLLAIRRAHIHLARLWQQSSLRRQRPYHSGYLYSNSHHGKIILNRGRERSARRERAMRPVWATCRAALFFLAEIEAYFQGAVVQRSFEHFLLWVDRSTNETRCGMEHSTSPPRDRESTTMQSHQDCHDPETLAQGHRSFMSSISYGLLITDTVFTGTLRTFCSHIDHLVAYITRLIDVEHNLDLEEDEGITDSSRNHEKEEAAIRLEMDRACRRLDSDLKGLIERLRELDNERQSTPKLQLSVEDRENTYQPPKVDSIHHLLMKLDWASESDSEISN